MPTAKDTLTNLRILLEGLHRFKLECPDYAERLGYIPRLVSIASVAAQLYPALRFPEPVRGNDL